MKNPNIKQVLAVAVILLFIGVAFAPSITAVNIAKDIPSKIIFGGDTLYVGGSGPGNYSTIQEAIDNASNGDTVFVFDDSSPYLENVIVNKSIELIGENMDTTIIDGGESGDVVSIVADSVNISGFTLDKNGHDWGDAGIDVVSDYNMISGNKFVYPDRFALFIHDSNSSIVKDNTFTNNGICIYIIDSSRNVIDYNNITTGQWGVAIKGSSVENIITNNTIVDAGSCILLESSHNNFIYDNFISSDLSGIRLEHSSNNLICRNIIEGYGYGERAIYLINSSENTFSQNEITIQRYGFYMIDSSQNNIIRNIILTEQAFYLIGSSDNNISENNIDSLYFDIWLTSSSNNHIHHNNIIGNRVHAFFLDSNNKWYNNYWDGARIFPKPIFGLMSGSIKSRLKVEFDLFPAQVPYEITID